MYEFFWISIRLGIPITSLIREKLILVSSAVLYGLDLYHKMQPLLFSRLTNLAKHFQNRPPCWKSSSFFTNFSIWLAQSTVFRALYSIFVILRQYTILRPHCQALFRHFGGIFYRASNAWVRVTKLVILPCKGSKNALDKSIRPGRYRHFGKRWRGPALDKFHPMW